MNETIVFGIVIPSAIFLSFWLGVFIESKFGRFSKKEDLP